MEDIKDYLRFLMPVFLIAIIMFSIVIGLSIGIEIAYQKNYCKTMQSIHTGFEFRWELWGGCLTKTPSGYWIDASEYNYLEGDVR